MSDFGSFEAGSAAPAGFAVDQSTANGRFPAKVPRGNARHNAGPAYAQRNTGPQALLSHAKCGRRNHERHFVQTQSNEPADLRAYAKHRGHTNIQLLRVV